MTVLTRLDLLDLLKQTNYEVYCHSVRTAKIASLICQKYNSLSNRYIDKYKVYTAGLYHDIGKIFIPNDILSKPAHLTLAEYKNIQSHVILGAECFKSIENNNDFIINGILHHHEREDGSGYPDALKGDTISVQGKILAIADVYDALASPRCYKKPWTHDKIIEHFLNNKQLYDKKLLDILMFNDVRKEIKKIYDNNDSDNNTNVTNI